MLFSEDTEKLEHHRILGHISHDGPRKRTRTPRLARLHLDHWGTMTIYKNILILCIKIKKCCIRQKIGTRVFFVLSASRACTYIPSTIIFTHTLTNSLVNKSPLKKRNRKLIPHSFDQDLKTKLNKEKYWSLFYII